MVSSLSTSFFCTHSLKSPTLKPLTKPHCFARLRFRVPPKASSQNKNVNTGFVETPSLQPSSPKPPYDSSSLLLRCFSNGWRKFDELGMEIVLIALPVALALAADPIASLIDTAFVGHIAIPILMVAAPVGLPGVWTGLFIFMALRVLAGLWRLSIKSGPWDTIWYKRWSRRLTNMHSKSCIQYSEVPTFTPQVKKPFS